MALDPKLRKFLPASVRRLQALTKQQAGVADRRKRKRITIGEINEFGAQALSSEQREALIKAPDKRSAFTKFLDVIDIPRNLVANAIAGITGVKPKQQRPGAILPKVWASDLLGALGMKKGVGRAVLGLTADIALDPLTYLTAGALTGKRIAAGLPKIVKPGTKAIKGTAVAAASGRVAGISADIARAAGMTPQRMARAGQALVKRGLARGLSRQKAVKQAVKALTSQQRIRGLRSLRAAQQGAKGTRRVATITGRIAEGAAGARGVAGAKASRAFIAKFGEKGRTLLRVPFAARGITVGGKRARQFKQIAGGTVTKDILKNIALKRQGIRGLAEASRVAAAGRAGTEALAVGQAAGKTARAAQVAEATRKQAQATGFTGRLLKQVGRGVPLPGGKATPKQVRELRRLTKQAVRPVRANEAQILRTIHGQSSDAARKAFDEFQKIEQAALAARRSGKRLTMARITADAARKRELKEVMSASQKALKSVPVEAEARLGQIGTEQAARQSRVSEIAASPLSSELTKAQSEAFLGKPFLTQEQARLVHGKVPPGGGIREASLGRRFVTEARRFKRQLFGGGTSEVGSLAAGAEAGIRSRAPAALQAAKAEWATKLDPIVRQLATKTGQSADELQTVLFRVVEAGAEGAKFVPEDPILQVFAKFQPLLDESARATLADYSRMHANILKELDAAGVGPGSLKDFLPRKLTEQFARVGSGEIKRTLVEAGFNPQRVKELRWTDDAGTVHKAFTSPTGEATAEVKRLTELFGKPERFDISTMRFNTDPTLAAKLQPDIANARIAQFKETIPEAAGALAKQRVTRLALADMKNVASGTGVPSEMLANQATRGRFPGFAQVRWEQFQNTPAFQTVFRGLADAKQAYPQQVVDLLERFMTLSNQPQEIRRWLGWTDKTLNLWKGVTLAHPAYTIRNVGQNLLGNWMAGQRMGAYMTQARPGSRVAQITNSALRGEQATGTIEISGRLWRAQDFADLITKNNIIMSGQIGEALPNVLQAPGQFVRKIRPLQRWFGLNSQIESTMKAASLWGFLDQGFDVQTALQKVAQAMPDLADLTKFERTVARRLIPFYSWFRKNGALQLFHYLPQKPAFAAAPAKIKQAMESAMRGDNVVPEELRPAWMQAMQAIQVSGDKEKGAVFLSASWLPFQELIKFGSGAFDIGEGARAVAEVGRPSLRFIAERAAGQDIFRRTPLEPVSPLGAVKQLPQALIGRGPLGGVLGVRPLREAFRVAEMPGVAEGAQRAVLGGAFQPVSRQRGLGAEYQRLRDLSMKLRQQINRALQVNDQSLADSLQRQYLQALIQMHQMGLPGVPQATQRVFRQGGLQAGAPAFEGR